MQRTRPGAKEAHEIINENKNIELNKDQLGEAAGGVWDAENGFAYYEGTVTDMGGRTAFVKIERLGEKECTYDHQLVFDDRFRIGSKVRVRFPERHIYIVILNDLSEGIVWTQKASSYG